MQWSASVVKGRVRMWVLGVALVVLGVGLCGERAHAVGWDDYVLGDFYAAQEADEQVMTDAAEAVVYFGNATGFLISASGYILTNHHVYRSFGDEGRVWRRWRGKGRFGEALEVEVVRAVRAYDMALYRVKGGDKMDLPFLKLRPEGAVVGEPVFLIGHPSSKPQQISFGKVLATDLMIKEVPSVEYSAQTWWGSSGSPVMDAKGQVVALHWGWDSEGQSNGRLTGVPIPLILADVEEVRKAAGAVDLPKSAKVDRCDDAALYALDVGALSLNVDTSPDGSLTFDRVQVRLTGEDPACLIQIKKVVYHLHPTFKNPDIQGDSAHAGHPITLKTWGFFDATATVTTGSGAALTVPGRVEWTRDEDGPETPDTRCTNAALYSIQSALLGASEGTTEDGTALDTVKVSLQSPEGCAPQVRRVVYHLHPTFATPDVEGDGHYPDHPVTMNAWGFFEASASVILWNADDSKPAVVLDVSGLVKWK